MCRGICVASPAHNTFSPSASTRATCSRTRSRFSSTLSSVCVVDVRSSTRVTPPCISSPFLIASTRATRPTVSHATPQGVRERESVCVCVRARAHVCVVDVMSYTRAPPPPVSPLFSSASLYTCYLLTDSVAVQFDAFLRGFQSVCGGECLQLFRWEELELLICGSPDLDFDVSIDQNRATPPSTAHFVFTAYLHSCSSSGGKSSSCSSPDLDFEVIVESRFAGFRSNSG